jgi:hydrogenase assembly chaperone HypC/HupF
MQIHFADSRPAGDYALVHVGFAISRIDEDEARRTFEALREMSQLDELDWLREMAAEELRELEGQAP